MGEYVLRVVGAAFCVGLLEELLPGECGSKAYVRFLTGLCLLAVLIAPVGRFLASLPDALGELSFPEEEQENAYERILRDNLSGAVREKLSAAVKQDLAERFGVKNERTEVGIRLSEEGALAVSRLVITLKGGDILKNPYEIEQYFSELLGCECLVRVG